MEWDQLGFWLGSMLGQGWAQNHHARHLEKGREVLDGMRAVSADDRQKAQGLFTGALNNDERSKGLTGYLGQDPKMMQLKLSKDYMQAQNDAQYLLNNGYAEDSEEVQGYRQKMNDAHANAEQLRAISGTRFGDLQKESAGLSLSELKDKINHTQYPGLYDAQQFDIGKQLADKHAWAGGVAQNILSGQGAQGQQSAQSKLAETLGLPEAQMQGAQTLTSADIYRYLQDNGQIAKDKTFDETIDEIAQQVARQRTASMSRSDVLKYLRGHGVGRGVAGELADEYVQNAQAQMRQEALARAAASSTSPQQAAFIAAMTADPRMKWSDMTGLLNATNPQMKLNTIDTGGAISALYGDERGRVPMAQTTFAKTLSPKDIADTDYKYRELGWKSDNANANRTMHYDIANANIRAAREREQMRAQNEMDQIAYRAALGMGGDRGSAGGRGKSDQQDAENFEFAQKMLERARAAVQDETLDREWDKQIVMESFEPLYELYKQHKGGIKYAPWIEDIYPLMEQLEKALQYKYGEQADVLYESTANE